MTETNKPDEFPPSDLSYEEVFQRYMDANEARIELQAENDRLRAALAHSDQPCVYCTLPAAEMAKCAHGFPGCSRADDAMGCPHLWQSLEAHESRVALAVPEGESLLDHVRMHLAEHEHVSADNERLAAKYGHAVDDFAGAVAELVELRAEVKRLQSLGLDALAAEGEAIESSEDIEFRLRERARIRREIPDRKSVQEGKPDRIADLLDEAANVIRWYREMYEDSRDQADRYVCEVNAASALLSQCQSYLDSPHFPHPGEKCKELKAKLREALGPVGTAAVTDSTNG